MKTQKFQKRKKLTLNKKTIARLNDAELKIVKGGIPRTWTRLNSCCAC
jgi:natural product precursor